jgi:DNA-binding CsgD family transcriptional regulator
LTDRSTNANPQLASLIEDVYDAAFNPALWHDTLKRLVEYTDTHSCGLTTKSATDGLLVTHHVGCREDFLQTYLDQYGKFDPTHAIWLCNVGEIHRTEDWLPIEDFHEGRFYQEWLRPQQLDDCASVLLENVADGFSYFCLMKGGGLVDDKFVRALKPIVPHFLRAAQIGQILPPRPGTSPAEFILDELRAAMFLLDGTGNIVHTNLSGRDILARKDFLRTQQGRLVVADPRLNRIFREAAAASIPGSGFAQRESIALPFVAHDGERFVGHVLPLTAGRRRAAGIAFGATAVLFVTRAALESEAASGIIRKLYKLTPTETRVMLAIIELGGIPEASRRLDIAESTVKTHLSRVFLKTETRRQADLVKLIAAFSSPVRS